MIPKVSGWSTPEARYERKQARTRAKAKAKDKAALSARLRLKLIRHAVYLRDHRKCRAFGIPLLLNTDNPLKLAECHHLVYRSAGGSDDAHNRITLSPKAHRMEHAGELDITGDPNTTVTFTQFAFSGGTRQIVHTWESRT